MRQTKSKISKKNSLSGKQHATALPKTARTPAIAKKGLSSVKKRRRITRRTELPTKNPVMPLDRARSLFGLSYEDPDLPSQYGMDTLVLLVRDPWWIFAYWEVTPIRQEAVLDDLKRFSVNDYKTVLRVYDVTGRNKDSAHSFFDIELNFFTQSWYIDAGLPGREWLCEIGYRLDSGEFFMLVSSNKVSTPAFGVSDVLDEEWMLPDEVFFKILGLSSGITAGGSSEQNSQLYARYMKMAMSSHSSPSTNTPKKT